MDSKKDKKTGTMMNKEENNQKAMVSIVLGAYNRLEYLKFTIDSVRNQAINMPHEIIVVDGGSTDGSIDWLSQQKDIITIIQYNRGEWNGQEIKRRSWGYFMNLGFKIAKGKYICMVSDDCIIMPDALKNGIELFEQYLNRGEKIGAMAFYWKDWPKNHMYEIRHTLSEKLYVNHGLYLRKALEEVGYIDEDNYMFYCADCDVCLKMWNSGYKCVESPDSYVIHYAHANLEVRKTNLLLVPKELEKLNKVWEGIYYHGEDDGYKRKIIYKRFDDRAFIENVIESRYPYKYMEENSKIVELNKLIDKECSNNNVVIYGAGEHTEMLLNRTNMYYMDIKYLVDKNRFGEEVLGYQIEKPEKILESIPDVIVISSYEYQDEIFCYLKNDLKYDGKVVLLYSADEDRPFYCC